MKENQLVEQSLAFAVRIIKLNKYLNSEKNEYVISKQVVRCGTSIGANVNEANYAQSKADFISKMHIALKETAETEYWLKVLALSEFLSEDLSKSLMSDCMNIKHMLISTINTAKEGLK